jgi:Fe-S cluster assembly protein SufD
MEPDPVLANLDPSQSVTVVDGRTGAVDSSGHMRAGLALADLVPTDLDKFAAAHRAFVTDGVTIRVPQSKHTEAPLLVDLQTVSSGAIVFPHVTIELEENAEAEVIVAHRARPGLGSYSVPQIEVLLAQSARLRLLALQELGDGSSIVSQVRARLGRDATLRLGEVGLGGELARIALGVNLEGQGSSAQVVGLFFGHRSQTLGYRMVLNHRGKDTSSNVLLKGAVEDAARSVFSGLVRIEKEANGTSAFETNRNLVLSPDAKANSIPNLEILCDDVVCGHGSSVGPLEEDHLYYLESRGISPARAERLLVRGFFNEVLAQLPVRGMEAALAGILERRFIRSQKDDDERS